MKETKNKHEGKYLEAVGRRKTSVARVRLFQGSAGMTVNGKDYKHYFPTEEMQKIVEAPFSKANPSAQFSVSALIKSGGIHSQAEAMRHGISRALLLFDKNLRTTLKQQGYLKRDPRMKERRKFGLKKARRAPQWAKR